MNITVTGTIQRINMGTGTWALKSNEGKTYELYELPSELLQSGLNVTIDAQVRDDVMTMAMIGPVLEVYSFQILK
jgi:hypothetical protein